MANDVVRIEKWVRRQMTDDTIVSDERKCIAFAVMHTSTGIAKEVQTLKLGSKSWEMRKLAESLSNIADDHAAGIAHTESGSGVEQYEIYSFFSDAPEVLGGRMTLSRRTSLGLMAEQGGSASEPPTPAGMLRQDMRQKEGWMQFVLEMTARTHDAHGKMMMAMFERNKILEAENYDAVQLAKELMFEKATSRHEHAMAEKAFDRKTEERRALMTLGPALVNQVAGKEIFPQSTADSSLIESLVESLDEEATKKLLNVLAEVLKPEQAVLLVGRMADIQERINERKAKKTAMAVTSNGVAASERPS